MTIQVFFADDHPLTVEGFQTSVKAYGIDVVEVANKLEGLPNRFSESHADVLVIDVRFARSDSEEDGLDVCEKILAKHPSAKIVVYSQFDDEYIIDKTYKLGALAFVRKDESRDILMQAIESAYKGKEFFSPVVAQQIAWATHRAHNPTRLLDEKELKILTLIADGASLSEVAKEMDLSYKTVVNAVKGVKEKLSIDNPADFTKLAIKYGLTNLDMKRKS